MDILTILLSWFIIIYSIFPIRTAYTCPKFYFNVKIISKLMDTRYILSLCVPSVVSYHIVIIQTSPLFVTWRDSAMAKTLALHVEMIPVQSLALYKVLLSTSSSDP